MPTTSAARPVDCVWQFTQLSASGSAGGSACHASIKCALRKPAGEAACAPGSRAPRDPAPRNCAPRKAAIMQIFAALRLIAPIRSFPLISVFSLFSSEDSFSFLEEGRDTLFEICGAKTNALVDRLEFERGGQVGLKTGIQSGF